MSTEWPSEAFLPERKHLSLFCVSQRGWGGVGCGGVDGAVMRDGMWVKCKIYCKPLSDLLALGQCQKDGSQ